MKVTFLVPSAKRPIGGVIALYEFANGLSRLGHEVSLVHLPVIEDHIDALADVDWFRFEPGVQHLFRPAALDGHDLPDADFIDLTALRFFTDSTFPGGGGAGPPARFGLPFLVVQAFGIFPAAVDAHAFRTPGLKVCVSRWLMDEVVASGEAQRDVAYVPNGIDHETFRRTRPLDERGAQVAMLFNSHPQKNPYDGLLALAEVRRRMPEMRVVVFGTGERPEQIDELIPDGVTYVRLPSRADLVDRIYNRSRVFVSSSFREGFGFCALEAMSCGCALVTNANGGSDEYAVDGENAFVCPVGDIDAMADRVERLLRDDALRVRIAERGQADAGRFDWDDSARRLEATLRDYAAREQASATA